MMNNFFSASAKHLLLLAIFLFLGFAQVWGQNVTIPTNGSNTMSCNGTLCDGGGCSGNYSSSNSGFTVIAGIPGQTINISGTYALETCNCDYIRIYSGAGISGTLLATFTNGSGNINYTGTSGQTLTVRFTSDGSVVSSGFNLNVSYSSGGACGGSVLVSGSNSNPIACGSSALLLDHAGATANYGNSRNDFTVLNNNSGSSATINITGAYSTESGYDFIRIYSGAGTGGSVVAGPFSGVGIINFTGNPGQTYTVGFTSDGNTTSSGFTFNINYSGSCAVPYQAEYISQSSGATTWCAGETRAVSVTIKNTGTQSWTDGGGEDFNIGFKWNADADYFVRVDAQNLAPGATQTYNFSVTAPTTTGTNNLNFNVVREGISWFGGNYASPAITILGVPTTATTPSPANNATGVCYTGVGAVNTISWAAVSGATGYDIYGGTTNPPTTLLSSNQAGISLNVGTLAANTAYYWRVAPRNSCGVNNSGPIWSFTTSAQPCYCLPTYSLGCSNTVDVITRVEIGTLNNSSTWGTTCATRYVDYSGSVTAPILNTGSTYQLKITTGNDSGNWTAAWFDFNNDGDFDDAGEYYNGGNAGANGTATINVTIPNNASSGLIRMRVRGGEDSNINSQSHACGASPSGYGEAEDYNVNIITPDYRVEWISMNYGAANWCSGESRTVSVTLRNGGTKTWNTDYTTRVGVKWNTNGGNWNDYHVRVNAGNLAPGQIQTYNFTLEAKNAMAGPTYGSDLSDGINNLTFDVVNEGNCWFGSNSNSCGPGNSVYVSPNIEIQPKPIANAGDDVILPCSGSIQLNATSNNTTLFSEDFGNGTPQELTNTTSNWRIFYRVGTHPANRTKWWIHNNTTQYPCVVNGSALLMQDPIISNQCDYAWDDGTMDEVAYNVNPIDGRLYTSINLGFDYKVTGERSGTTVYDYFQVVYSLDNGATWITLNTGNNGAGYSFTNNNGVNNGFFSLATTPASPNITPASGTHNVDLTFLAGQRFLIGFRWHNDGAAGNYNNFFIDNILVTGNANYAWSPTSGVTNPNTATPTITQNNTYTVTVTAGNGCSTSDAVTVNNTTIPVVPNPNNNTPICKGLDVNVNANGLAPGGQYATLNGSGNSINGNTLSGTLNNHTVEFWVKPNKSIILPNQINSGISGSLSPSENNFAIAPDQIGGIGCTVTSAGTGISVGTNGIAVYQHGPCHFPATLVYPTTISDWVHVAVVHLSNVPYLYLNGNLVKQGLSSLYPTFPNTGTGQAYGHFNGDIDNIRVWSTSRTIAQIQSEMFLETPSNNSGLIAHYTYNGNANASVGSNNTNNGATFSNANYFTYSWSGTSAPSPANTNEARTIVGMPVGSNNLSVTASRNICTSNATNTTVIVNDNNQTATSWTAGSPSNNTDWFDPRNWSNCTPGSNSVVTISRDKPAFPIVNNTSSFDINNPKGKAKAKKVTMDTSGSGSLPTLNINSNTELRVNE